MFFHSDESPCIRPVGNTYVSNPSRDVFPFWLPPMQMRWRRVISFKPFQGCFSILTLKTGEALAQAPTVVSNPSRDVFPFWLRRQIRKQLVTEVSNPSRDVFPFWLKQTDARKVHQRGFKPFQGCFSILTYTRWRLEGGFSLEFQTLPGMFFHSDQARQFLPVGTESPMFQTLPGMFFHSDKH